MRASARLGSVAALLLSIGMTAEAAEPSLTVKGAASSGAAAQAQSLATQAAGLASAATPGSGPMLTLDPSRSARSMPGFSSLSAADQNLALAGDAINQLIQSLGGSAGGGGALLQRRDNMYYIGVDGEGGRWFASAEQAISFMFQAKVAKSSNFGHDSKQAAFGCAQDLLCAVLAVVKDPYFTIATVARGASVTVSVAGAGFSGQDGGPTLASDDGISAQSVIFQSPEQLIATLKIAPTVKLGEHLVAVFNAGRGFKNTGVYKLIVQDGVGDAPRTEASTRALAAPLPLTGAAAGQLAGDGADQFWKIDLTALGTLTVTSLGGTDVKATLEDAGGTALASDDDSGGWYNFKLARALVPGAYYLRVGHCCSGSGAYKLSATLAP